MTVTQGSRARVSQNSATITSAGRVFLCKKNCTVRSYGVLL